VILGLVSPGDLFSSHSGGAGRQGGKETGGERILVQAELANHPPKYGGPAMLHTDLPSHPIPHITALYLLSSGSPILPQLSVPRNLGKQ